MALLFFDSFDLYGTSTAAAQTRYLTNGGTQALDTSVKRTGNASYRLGTSTAWLGRGLSSQKSTIIVGFGFRTSNIAEDGQLLFEFWGGGALHVNIELGSGSTIRAERNGTNLGSAAHGMSTNTWYYLEIKVVIHDSTGSVEIRRDGTTILNLTGVDTRNGSPTGIDECRMVNTGTAGQQKWYDDFYICDDQGSTNNDFLGPVSVYAMVPDGAGAHADFTRGGSDSGANWSQCEEVGPNGDTDYVYSATTNQKDSYSIGNLTPTGGTIKGVASVCYGKVDTSGSRTIANTIRTNSTDFDGSNKTLTTSYAYKENIWETNPDTTNPWTVSEVNALEAGVKVTA